MIVTKRYTLKIMQSLKYKTVNQYANKYTNNSGFIYLAAKVRI